MSINPSDLPYYQLRSTRKTDEEKTRDQQRINDLVRQDLLQIQQRLKQVGMTVVQTQTLAVVTASVSFLNIPKTGRHLQIVWKARGDTAANAVDFRGRLNNVSSVSYSNEALTASGASVTLANTSDTSFKAGSLVAASAGATALSGGVIEIPDYTDASFAGAVVLSRTTYSNAAGATAILELDACQFVSAPPITRVDLFPAVGNFTAGSSFTLYILN